MGKRTAKPTVVSKAGLRSFFVHAVQSAARNQHIQAQRGTVEYVGDLLTRYADASAVFESSCYGYGLTPLAELYARAIEEPAASVRALAFKRLGDVALFVAGLFPGSLNRQLVGLDYYIAMGGSAYAALSESVPASRSCGEVRRADPSCARNVFADLSRNFRVFVDVLDEVSERSPAHGDCDVLQTYETWLATGSAQLAKRLQRFGVIPVRFEASDGPH